jgi:putative hydrolase of the HAD superfamily
VWLPRLTRLPARGVTQEQRNHLPLGALFAAAFAEHRLHPAITGHVTDSQWRAGVVAALEHEHGGVAAERAVAALLGLDREFDAIFNSSDMGFAKPDQRVFIYIANALGVPRSHCLFVGDTPANVAAATQVGLRAHQYRSPEDLIVFVDMA